MLNVMYVWMPDITGYGLAHSASEPFIRECISLTPASSESHHIALIGNGVAHHAIRDEPSYQCLFALRAMLLIICLLGEYDVKGCPS